jgi:hypothetical protein
MCRWVFILPVLLSAVISQAQFSAIDQVTVIPKTGFLIAHRPFMSHLVRENSYGLEICIWEQEKLSEELTQRLNNPLRGLSLEFRDFGYKDVLGSAFSATSYMVFPLISTSGNSYLDLTMGAGIGYLTRCYDVVENPLNNAIGSKLNARVNVKISFTKYLTNTHWGGGIEFMHFSNGTLKTPNLGLNLPSLYLNFGYNLNPRIQGIKQAEKTKTPVDAPHHLSTEIIVTAKEIGAIPFLPKLYPVFAGRLSYTHSERGLWGSELALDIIHNESNFHKYTDTTFVRCDILQIGVYAGAYVQFYKSQLAFGLGWYARDRINPEGRLYNRIGYRYYFAEKWFALFTVKANYAKADYFEFGLGYKFLSR